VYLTANAVNNLLLLLPAGSDYYLGIVLIVMLTGQLVAARGSLARAVFPLVSDLRWGWHACERVLERGSWSINTLLEVAYQWCLRELAAEVVRLGPQQREIQALDTSTIARWRATRRLGAAGKGYWGRAGKAVRANLVAAVNSVVLIGGIRLGIVRRVEFGATCAEATAKLFADLPKCAGPRLLVVDAGIATREQFAAATEQDALLGRLRINGKLRAAPPPQPPGKRGRKPKHGPVLHPGRAEPELPPDEEVTVQTQATDQEAERSLRLRRWVGFHFEEAADTVIDLVRVDDPKYDKPLLLGTTARELRTTEFLPGYQCRATIETNFYVAQDTAGMEMPRAFAEPAVTRRIGLALLAGGLLKALAARCEPLALGPWDRQPQRSGGRLAHYLRQRLEQFQALALRNTAPKNHPKIAEPLKAKNLAAETLG
jgi:hypothetical protein